MKYFFPVHIDGGNRGCEGIAKGSAILLNEPREQLVGLCTDVETDVKLGVDKFVSLKTPRKLTKRFRILNRLFSYFQRFRNKDSYDQSLYYFKFVYGDFLNKMSPGDVLVSTGGDMMCYGDNFAIYTALEAKRRGCKTILWGCSMGDNNLTPRKLKALRSFDVIYARETLSRDFFMSLGLQHVICFPDPAFALEAVPINHLPHCLSTGKTIGINLSNLTVGAFSLNTTFGREVERLMDYILAETDYNILLIPHVTWSGQDDRVLALSVFEEFNSVANGRINVLDIDNLNYLNIRYVISKCHIFIGGRTHAMISAYSTCTPAIALGYSIKSRGIAKDLGLSELLVVDTKKESFNGELLASFKFADKKHDSIKSHLKCIIPNYCERLKLLKAELPL